MLPLPWSGEKAEVPASSSRLWMARWALCWKFSLVLLQPLTLELQRHTTKQLDVLIISLDSNAAAIIVDQAQEAARRGTWKKHKQARNPELQPTPPPAAPSRRLVTVVREKTRSRSSFCQLDGKAGDKLMVDTATSSPPSFPPTPTSLASPYSCSPSTSSAPGPCPTPTSAATPSVLENAYCVLCEMQIKIWKKNSFLMSPWHVRMAGRFRLTRRSFTLWWWLAPCLTPRSPSSISLFSSDPGKGETDVTNALKIVTLPWLA